MQSGSVTRVAQMTHHCTVKNVTHKRRLSRSAHAGNNRHHPQRKFHIDILEVVLPGSRHLYVVAPLATTRRHGYRQLAVKITHRIGVGGCHEFVDIALIYYLAAVSTRLGTHIDKIVGGTHYLLVVLHDHHGVAELLQLSQHADQLHRVTRVKSYARFVENVERSHKTASERCSKIDALALTARQCRRKAVESQVTQPHITQETDAIVYLHEQSRRNELVVIVKLKSSKPLLQVGDRHLHQLRNRGTAHLYIFTLLAKPRPVTLGTTGLASVTCQHNTILYLVLVLLDHLEKSVDALEPSVAVPQHIQFGLSKVAIGTMNREPDVGSQMYQFTLPLAHLVASPAHNGIVVDRQRRVGHNQIGVDAYHPSETLTPRTSAIRVVEVEHQLRGLAEHNTVGLKSLGEVMSVQSVGSPHEKTHLVMSLKKRRFHRIGKSAQLITLVGHRQTVDKEVIARSRFRQTVIGEKMLNVNEFPVLDKTRISAFKQHLELSPESALFRKRDRSYHRHARTFGITACHGYYILHGVLLHKLAGDRRVGLAYTAKQQSDVIVYFSRSSHGRSGISCIYLLLNGYGRRKSLYKISFRLGHLSEELSRISRQALDITALSLGEYGVEGKSRLARSRKTRYDGQRLVGDRKLDVFKVVDACALDMYGVIV